MIDIAALFRLHQGEVQGYLRKRGISPELAADLTQEAFLRLLSSPPDASVKNAAAYLFRTAANLSTDWRRRQRFLPMAVDQEAALAAAVDDLPSAERQVISRQELAIVQAALNEIPAAVRFVFFARLDGMTFAEIGKRLGISPNTAFSQMNRVMILLRTSLDYARQ
ncbi:RNA polymerase sigma factor [Bradyrhizobium sp.]|uniref:RNA polymerase sigma factor n=1 Tax=Bradyrhizobium sp. TaxID=376 RepID=UPI0039E30A7C